MFWRGCGLWTLEIHNYFVLFEMTHANVSKGTHLYRHHAIFNCIACRGYGVNHLCFLLLPDSDWGASLEWMMCVCEQLKMCNYEPDLWQHHSFGGNHCLKSSVHMWKHANKLLFQIVFFIHVESSGGEYKTIVAQHTDGMWLGNKQGIHVT